MVQRGESLMGLAFLTTLYCAIRVAEGRHRVAWGSAATLACALGMGTKEVMVTAPLVVLLHDRVRDPDRTAFSEYHDGGSTTGAFMVRWDNWKYVHYQGERPLLFSAITR